MSFADVPPPSAFLVVLFFFWVAILVHELGHALTAVLSGWRLIVFSVGPLGFHLSNKNVAWVPKSKRKEFQGFVLVVPKNPAVWTPLREGLIDAGGSAANIILAIALLCPWQLWMLSYPPAWVLTGFGFGILSLATGISALLPHTDPNASSDGQNIVRSLKRDRTEWRRVRSLIHSGGLLRYQVRLRHLPQWMIDEARQTAAAGEDEKARHVFDSLIIGIVLDSRPMDEAQARELLDNFRRRYGGSAWLDSCDAYLAAVWEGDAERARERLWRGEPQEEMRPMILAADAAVNARSGNADATRNLLAEMRAAVRKRSIFPDLTFRDIERQIVALLPS